MTKSPSNDQLGPQLTLIRQNTPFSTLLSPHLSTYPPNISQNSQKAQNIGKMPLFGQKTPVIPKITRESTFDLSTTTSPVQFPDHISRKKSANSVSFGGIFDDSQRELLKKSPKDSNSIVKCEKSSNLISIENNKNSNNGEKNAFFERMYQFVPALSAEYLSENFITILHTRPGIIHLGAQDDGMVVLFSSFFKYFPHNFAPYLPIILSTMDTYIIRLSSAHFLAKKSALSAETSLSGQNSFTPLGRHQFFARFTAIVDFYATLVNFLPQVYLFSPLNPPHSNVFLPNSHDSSSRTADIIKDSFVIGRNAKKSTNIENKKLTGMGKNNTKMTHFSQNTVLSAILYRLISLFLIISINYPEYSLNIKPNTRNETFAPNGNDNNQKNCFHTHPAIALQLATLYFNKFKAINDINKKNTKIGDIDPFATEYSIFYPLYSENGQLYTQNGPNFNISMTGVNTSNNQPFFHNFAQIYGKSAQIGSIFDNNAFSDSLIYQYYPHYYEILHKSSNYQEKSIEIPQVIFKMHALYHIITISQPLNNPNFPTNSSQTTLTHFFCPKYVNSPLITTASALLLPFVSGLCQESPPNPSNSLKSQILDVFPLKLDYFSEKAHFLVLNPSIYSTLPLLLQIDLILANLTACLGDIYIMSSLLAQLLSIFEENEAEFDDLCYIHTILSTSQPNSRGNTENIEDNYVKLISAANCDINSDISPNSVISDAQLINIPLNWSSTLNFNPLIQNSIDEKINKNKSALSISLENGNYPLNSELFTFFSDANPDTYHSNTEYYLSIENLYKFTQYPSRIAKIDEDDRTNYLKRTHGGTPLPPLLRKSLIITHPDNFGPFQKISENTGKSSQICENSENQGIYVANYNIVPILRNLIKFVFSKLFYTVKTLLSPYNIATTPGTLNFAQIRLNYLILLIKTQILSKIHENQINDAFSALCHVPLLDYRAILQNNMGKYTPINPTSQNLTNLENSSILSNIDHNLYENSEIIKNIYSFKQYAAILFPYGDFSTTYPIKSPSSRQQILFQSHQNMQKYEEFILNTPLLNQIYTITAQNILTTSFFSFNKNLTSPPPFSLFYSLTAKPCAQNTTVSQHTFENHTLLHESYVNFTKILSLLRILPNNMIIDTSPHVLTIILLINYLLPALTGTNSLGNTSEKSKNSLKFVKKGKIQAFNSNKDRLNVIKHTIRQLLTDFGINIDIVSQFNNLTHMSSIIEEHVLSNPNAIPTNYRFFPLKNSIFNPFYHYSTMLHPSWLVLEHEYDSAVKLARPEKIEKTIPNKGKFSNPTTTDDLLAMWTDLSQITHPPSHAEFIQQYTTPFTYFNNNKNNNNTSPKKSQNLNSNSNSAKSTSNQQERDKPLLNNTDLSTYNIHIITTTETTQNIETGQKNGQKSQKLKKYRYLYPHEREKLWIWAVLKPYHSILVDCLTSPYFSKNIPQNDVSVQKSINTIKTNNLVENTTFIHKVIQNSANISKNIEKSQKMGQRSPKQIQPQPQPQQQTIEGVENEGGFNQWVPLITKRLVSFHTYLSKQHTPPKSSYLESFKDFMTTMSENTEKFSNFPILQYLHCIFPQKHFECPVNATIERDTEIEFTREQENCLAHDKPFKLSKSHKINTKYAHSPTDHPILTYFFIHTCFQPHPALLSSNITGGDNFPTNTEQSPRIISKAQRSVEETEQNVAISTIHHYHTALQHSISSIIYPFMTILHKLPVIHKFIPSVSLFILPLLTQFSLLIADTGAATYIYMQRQYNSTEFNKQQSFGANCMTNSAKIADGTGNLDLDPAHITKVTNFETTLAAYPLSPQDQRKLLHNSPSNAAQGDLLLYANTGVNHFTQFTPFFSPIFDQDTPIIAIYNEISDIIHKYRYNIVYHQDNGNYYSFLSFFFKSLYHWMIPLLRVHVISVEHGIMPLRFGTDFDVLLYHHQKMIEKLEKIEKIENKPLDEDKQQIFLRENALRMYDKTLSSYYSLYHRFNNNLCDYTGADLHEHSQYSQFLQSIEKIDQNIDKYCQILNIPNDFSPPKLGKNEYLSEFAYSQDYNYSFLTKVKKSVELFVTKLKNSENQPNLHLSAKDVLNLNIYQLLALKSRLIDYYQWSTTSHPSSMTDSYHFSHFFNFSVKHTLQCYQALFFAFNNLANYEATNPLNASLSDQEQSNIIELAHRSKTLLFLALNVNIRSFALYQSTLASQHHMLPSVHNNYSRPPTTSNQVHEKSIFSTVFALFQSSLITHQLNPAENALLSYYTVKSPVNNHPTYNMTDAKFMLLSPILSTFFWRSLDFDLEASSFSHSIILRAHTHTALHTYLQTYRHRLSYIPPKLTIRYYLERFFLFFALKAHPQYKLIFDCLINNTAITPSARYSLTQPNVWRSGVPHGFVEYQREARENERARMQFDNLGDDAGIAAKLFFPTPNIFVSPYQWSEGTLNSMLSHNPADYFDIISPNQSKFVGKEINNVEEKIFHYSSNLEITQIPRVNQHNSTNIHAHNDPMNDYSYYNIDFYNFKNNNLHGIINYMTYFFSIAPPIHEIETNLILDPHYYSSKPPLISAEQIPPLSYFIHYGAWIYQKYWLNNVEYKNSINSLYKPYYTQYRDEFNENVQHLGHFNLKFKHHYTATSPLLNAHYQQSDDHARYSPENYKFPYKIKSMQSTSRGAPTFGLQTCHDNYIFPSYLDPVQFRNSNYPALIQSLQFVPKGNGQHYQTAARSPWNHNWYHSPLDIGPIWANHSSHSIDVIMKDHYSLSYAPKLLFSDFSHENDYIFTSAILPNEKIQKNNFDKLRKNLEHYINQNNIDASRFSFSSLNRVPAGIAPNRELKTLIAWVENPAINKYTASERLSSVLASTGHRSNIGAFKERFPLAKIGYEMKDVSVATHHINETLSAPSTSHMYEYYANFNTASWKIDDLDRIDTKASHILYRSNKIWMVLTFFLSVPFMDFLQQYSHVLRILHHKAVDNDFITPKTLQKHKNNVTYWGDIFFKYQAQREKIISMRVTHTPRFIETSYYSRLLELRLPQVSGTAIPSTLGQYEPSIQFTRGFESRTMLPNIPFTADNNRGNSFYGSDHFYYVTGLSVINSVIYYNTIKQRFAPQNGVELRESLQCYVKNYKPIAEPTCDVENNLIYLNNNTYVYNPTNQKYHENTAITTAFVTTVLYKAIMSVMKPYFLFSSCINDTEYVSFNQLIPENSERYEKTTENEHITQVYNNIIATITSKYSIIEQYIITQLFSTILSPPSTHTYIQPNTTQKINFSDFSQFLSKPQKIAKNRNHALFCQKFDLLLKYLYSNLMHTHNNHKTILSHQQSSRSPSPHSHPTINGSSMSTMLLPYGSTTSSSDMHALPLQYSSHQFNQQYPHMPYSPTVTYENYNPNIHVDHIAKRARYGGESIDVTGFSKNLLTPKLHPIRVDPISVDHLVSHYSSFNADNPLPNQLMTQNIQCKSPNSSYTLLNMPTVLNNIDGHSNQSSPTASNMFANLGENRLYSSLPTYTTCNADNQYQYDSRMQQNLNTSSQFDSKSQQDLVSAENFTEMYDFSRDLLIQLGKWDVMYDLDKNKSMGDKKNINIFDITLNDVENYQNVIIHVNKIVHDWFSPETELTITNDMNNNGNNTILSQRCRELTEITENYNRFTLLYNQDGFYNERQSVVKLNSIKNVSFLTDFVQFAFSGINTPMKHRQLIKSLEKHSVFTENLTKTLRSDAILNQKLIKFNNVPNIANTISEYRQINSNNTIFYELLSVLLADHVKQEKLRQDTSVDEKINRVTLSLMFRNLLKESYTISALTVQQSIHTSNDVFSALDRAQNNESSNLISTLFEALPKACDTVISYKLQHNESIVKATYTENVNTYYDDIISHQKSHFSKQSQHFNEKTQLSKDKVDKFEKSTTDNIFSSDNNIIDYKMYILSYYTKLLSKTAHSTPVTPFKSSHTSTTSNISSVCDETTDFLTQLPPHILKESEVSSIPLTTLPPLQFRHIQNNYFDFKLSSYTYELAAYNAERWLEYKYPHKHTNVSANDSAQNSSIKTKSVDTSSLSVSQVELSTIIRQLGPNYAKYSVLLKAVLPDSSKETEKNANNSNNSSVQSMTDDVVVKISDTNDTYAKHVRLYEEFHGDRLISSVFASLFDDLAEKYGTLSENMITSDSNLTCVRTYTMANHTHPMLSYSVHTRSENVTQNVKLFEFVDYYKHCIIIQSLFTLSAFQTSLNTDYERIFEKIEQKLEKIDSNHDEKHSDILFEVIRKRYDGKLHYDIHLDAYYLIKHDTFALQQFIITTIQDLVLKVVTFTPITPKVSVPAALPTSNANKSLKKLTVTRATRSKKNIQILDEYEDDSLFSINKPQDKTPKEDNFAIDIITTKSAKFNWNNKSIAMCLYYNQPPPENLDQHLLHNDDKSTVKHSKQSIFDLASDNEVNYDQSILGVLYNTTQYMSHDILSYLHEFSAKLTQLDADIIPQLALAITHYNALLSLLTVYSTVLQQYSMLLLKLPAKYRSDIDLLYSSHSYSSITQKTIASLPTNKNQKEPPQTNFSNHNTLTSFLIQNNITPEEYISLSHIFNISLNSPPNITPIFLFAQKCDSLYETTRTTLHTILNVYNTVYSDFQPLLENCLNSELNFNKICHLPEISPNCQNVPQNAQAQQQKTKILAMFNSIIQRILSIRYHCVTEKGEIKHFCKKDEILEANSAYVSCICRNKYIQRLLDDDSSSNEENYAIDSRKDKTYQQSLNTVTHFVMNQLFTTQHHIENDGISVQGLREALIAYTKTYSQSETRDYSKSTEITDSLNSNLIFPHFTPISTQIHSLFTKSPSGPLPNHSFSEQSLLDTTLSDNKLPIYISSHLERQWTMEWASKFSSDPFHSFIQLHERGDPNRVETYIYKHLSGNVISTPSSGFIAETLHDYYRYWLNSTGDQESLDEADTDEMSNLIMKRTKTAVTDSNYINIMINDKMVLDDGTVHRIDNNKQSNTDNTTQLSRSKPHQSSKTAPPALNDINIDYLYWLSYFMYPSNATMMSWLIQDDSASQRFEKQTIAQITRDPNTAKIFRRSVVPPFGENPQTATLHSITNDKINELDRLSLKKVFLSTQFGNTHPQNRSTPVATPTSSLIRNEDYVSGEADRENWCDNTCTLQYEIYHFLCIYNILHRKIVKLLQNMSFLQTNTLISYISSLIYSNPSDSGMSSNIVNSHHHHAALNILKNGASKMTKNNFFSIYTANTPITQSFFSHRLQTDFVPSRLFTIYINATDLHTYVATVLQRNNTTINQALQSARKSLLILENDKLFKQYLDTAVDPTKYPTTLPSSLFHRRNEQGDTSDNQPPFSRAAFEVKHFSSWLRLLNTIAPPSVITNTEIFGLMYTPFCPTKLFHFTKSTSAQNDIPQASVLQLPPVLQQIYDNFVIKSFDLSPSTSSPAYSAYRAKNANVPTLSKKNSFMYYNTTTGEYHTYCYAGEPPTTHAAILRSLSPTNHTHFHYAPWLGQQLPIIHSLMLILLYIIPTQQLKTLLPTIVANYPMLNDFMYKAYAFPSDKPSKSQSSEIQQTMFALSTPYIHHTPGFTQLPLAQTNLNKVNTMRNTQLLTSTTVVREFILHSFFRLPHHTIWSISAFMAIPPSQISDIRKKRQEHMNNKDYKLEGKSRHQLVEIESLRALYDILSLQLSLYSSGTFSTWYGRHFSGNTQTNSKNLTLVHQYETRQCFDEISGIGGKLEKFHGKLRLFHSYTNYSENIAPTRGRGKNSMSDENGEYENNEQTVIFSLLKPIILSSGSPLGQNQMVSERFNNMSHETQVILDTITAYAIERNHIDRSDHHKLANIFQLLSLENVDDSELDHRTGKKVTNQSSLQERSKTHMDVLKLLFKNYQTTPSTASPTLGHQKSEKIHKKPTHLMHPVLHHRKTTLPENPDPVHCLPNHVHFATLLFPHFNITPHTAYYLYELLSSSKQILKHFQQLASFPHQDLFLNIQYQTKTMFLVPFGGFDKDKDIYRNTYAMNNGNYIVLSKLPINAVHQSPDHDDLTSAILQLYNDPDWASFYTRISKQRAVSINPRNDPHPQNKSIDHANMKFDPHMLQQYKNTTNRWAHALSLLLPSMLSLPTSFALDGIIHCNLFELSQTTPFSMNGGKTIKSVVTKNTHRSFNGFSGGRDSFNATNDNVTNNDYKSQHYDIFNHIYPTFTEYSENNDVLANGNTLFNPFTHINSHSINAFEYLSLTNTGYNPLHTKRTYNNQYSYTHHHSQQHVYNTSLNTGNSQKMHNSLGLSTISSMSAPLITIYGLCDIVLLFNSKERPQKVTMMGSDGWLYSFVFKRENRGDMRKDYYVMNIVETINNIIRGSPAINKPLTIQSSNFQNADESQLPSFFNPEQISQQSPTIRPLNYYLISTLCPQTAILEWVPNSSSLRTIVDHYTTFTASISLDHTNNRVFLFNTTSGAIGNGPIIEHYNTTYTLSLATNPNNILKIGEGGDPYPHINSFQQYYHESTKHAQVKEIWMPYVTPKTDLFLNNNIPATTPTNAGNSHFYNQTYTPFRKILFEYINATQAIYAHPSSSASSHGHVSDWLQPLLFGEGSNAQPRPFQRHPYFKVFSHFFENIVLPNDLSGGHRVGNGDKPGDNNLNNSNTSQYDPRGDSAHGNDNPQQYDDLLTMEQLVKNKNIIKSLKVLHYLYDFYLYRKSQRLEKYLVTMRQLPNQILSTFHHTRTKSVEEWKKFQTNYQYTFISWSMIGYIIGLGDRHTENVMISNQHGSVVHVDFDCVYDKGRTLPVPELVPFRCTPNMVNGLGVGGIEMLLYNAMQFLTHILKKNFITLFPIFESLLLLTTNRIHLLHSTAYTTTQMLKHVETMENEKNPPEQLPNPTVTSSGGRTTRNKALSSSGGDRSIQQTDFCIFNTPSHLQSYDASQVILDAYDNEFYTVLPLRNKLLGNVRLTNRHNVNYDLCIHQYKQYIDTQSDPYTGEDVSIASIIDEYYKLEDTSDTGNDHDDNNDKNEIVVEPHNLLSTTAATGIKQEQSGQQRVNSPWLTKEVRKRHQQLQIRRKIVSLLQDQHDYKHNKYHPANLHKKTIGQRDIVSEYYQHGSNISYPIFTLTSNIEMIFHENLNSPTNSHENKDLNAHIESMLSSILPSSSPTSVALQHQLIDDPIIRSSTYVPPYIHAQLLISEATDPEHLMSMFHGWMPWV